MDEEQLLSFAARMWARSRFDVEVTASGLVITWGDVEVYHGDALGALEKLEQETGKAIILPKDEKKRLTGFSVCC